MEELRLWAAPVAAIISISTALWVWLTSPAKAAAAAATAVATRVDGFEQRLAKVENEVAHLPDTETFHQLALGVSEMRGDLKALSERVSAAAAISDRLEQWLLKQGK